MTTIKSYTDLSQSKTLSKILPFESVDMYYWCADHYPKEDWIIEVGTPDDNYECICAWSLSALLGVLPMITKGKDTANPFIAKTPNNEYYVVYATLTKEVDSSAIYDNPVDACVAMIERLHELNLM